MRMCLLLGNRFTRCCSLNALIVLAQLAAAPTQRVMSRSQRSPSTSAAAPTPLAHFKSSLATRERMKSRGGAIQFMGDRLMLDLKELDRQIAADKLAQREYAKQFAAMAARKAELRKKIAQQQEFTVQFDQQIGPFESRYSELQHSVDGLHSEAQVKYRAAVQLLVDKLGYHPAYKRHKDLI